MSLININNFSDLPNEVVDCIFSFVYSGEETENNISPDARCQEVFEGFTSTQLKLLQKVCEKEKSNYLFQCIEPRELAKEVEKPESHKGKVQIFAKISELLQSLGFNTARRVRTPEDVTMMIKTTEDATLEKIWPRVIKAFPMGTRTPAENMSAAEIRAWMGQNPAAMHGIVKLDLNGLDLFCVPREIELLTGLQILYLSNNKISRLPPEIKKLVHLEHLSLKNNLFTSFPLEIEAFTESLEILNLSQNPITTLSGITQDFRALQWLDLSHLKLQEFPQETLSHFSPVNNLLNLDLSHNQLEELPQNMEGFLGNLQTLNLSFNKLKNLPGWIGDLPNLEDLILKHNYLFEVPESIGNLTHLTGLDISENFLTKLPSTISQLVLLQSLLLNDNILQEIPLGNFQQLGVLDLSNNELTEWPEEIGDLVNLVELRLNHNSLKTLPQNIEALQHLRKLFLNHNEFEILPKELGKLKGLHSLALNHNRLETLPKEIGELENLSELSLDHNKLQTLENIGHLTSLRTLRVEGNQLTTLEGCKIENISLLCELYVANNRLTDIPEAIRGLPYLKKLTL